MSFKEARKREKYQKMRKRGFRGYPIATVACYGPTAERASKAVVGILAFEDAEADPMRKWYSETKDVRADPRIQEEVFRFIDDNAPKSIVIADRIIGCPHEEGIDYPEGESCPLCPYWRNRDRFTGEVIQ